MPIIGTYPCCGGDLWIVIPDDGPWGYGPAICEHCGAAVWHYYSNFKPRTWTDKDFRAQFDVDDDKKTIKSKPTGEISK